MAGPNKAGKCENGYCEIPGRTFTMGSPKGVGEPNEHPQRQVTLSTKWLRRTEVTVDEMTGFLAKGPQFDLYVVLSGCSSLDKAFVHFHNPKKGTINGKPGESERALLKRAREIAGQARCSVDKLKVDRRPKRGIDVNERCGEQNSRGGDHPVVCVGYDQMEAFCASEGGTLPSEALIESASRGPSGTDEYGNPIETAAIHENLVNKLKPSEQLGTQPVCGPHNETEGPFGVCDLAGNVWERTSDYYPVMTGPSLTDGIKTVSGIEHSIFRGGSFMNDQESARASYRRRSPSSRFGLEVGGFRCERSNPPKS